MRSLTDSVVGLLLTLSVGLPATLMLLLPSPSPAQVFPETPNVVRKAPIASNFNPAAALDVTQVTNQ